MEDEEKHEIEVQALPMAAQAFSRPHAGDQNEPIPRRPIFGPDKTEAEGRPSEVMIILGWGLDTRRLIMYLPEDKFAVWMNDLKELSQPDRSITTADLESLIGRLNHATRIIPLSRHFLNELRQRLKRHKARNWRGIRLSRQERLDLKLWEHFLKVGKEGISLNLIIDRMPTRMAWSDSCPVGIGGYTLGGRAWRIMIPKEFPFWGDDIANNLLEFLGLYVSVELMIQESEDEDFPCLLALGDNTSAIAWVMKTSKVKTDSVYYEATKMVARRLAQRCIEANVKLDTQHISGVHNDVSDLLSYHADWRGEDKINDLTGDDPDNETLTERFHSHLAHLIPQTFQISQLPEEVESFVFATLQTFSKSYIRNKKAATRTKTGPGGGGPSTSKDWESLTPTSMRFQDGPKPESPRPSLSSSVSVDSTTQATFLASVREQWWLQASQKPLASWHRRCGVTTGQVLSTSKAEPTVRLSGKDGAEI